MSRTECIEKKASGISGLVGQVTKGREVEAWAKSSRTLNAMIGYLASILELMDSY